MPLFTADKQLTVVEEDVAGVIPSGSPLTDVTNATILLKSASLVPDVELFEQDFLREGITPTPNITGLQLAALTAEFDLKGTATGAFGTIPNFDPLLLAANMRRAVVNTITINTVTSGPFLVGDVVTDGTGTGTVLAEARAGDVSLYVEQTSVADFDGASAITSATGSAGSAQSAYDDDAGYAWLPVTKVVKQVDIVAAAGGDGMAAGDTFRGSLSDAVGRVHVSVVDTDTTLQFIPIRGGFVDTETLTNLGPSGAGDEVTEATVAETYTQAPTIAMRLYEDGIGTTARGMRTNIAFTMVVNRPATVTVTGTGVLDSVADFADIGAIAYDFTTAPLWNESALAIGLSADADTDAEVVPCIENLTYDFGNNLANVLCAAEIGGLREVMTTAREGTGTMDPEATPESDYAWVGNWQTGALATFRASVGTALGNKFLLFWPAIQTTGAPVVDKDGRMARSLAFRATGGSRTLNNDNEFTLIYLTV